MLSHGLIGLPHFGQADGGETMDFPAGIRRMQTFKKLPIAKPNANATAPIKAVEGIVELCHSERCASSCDVRTVPEF